MIPVAFMPANFPPGLVARGWPRLPGAFTLVELLVVITIIAVLTGVLLPVLGAVGASGKATKCASNLRQIGTLTQLYLQDHDRVLPQRYYGPASDGEELGYCELLIPYFDGKTPPSRSALAAKLFTCPGHLHPNYPNDPSYGMNWFYDNQNIATVEHPARTIFVAETLGSNPQGLGSRRADRDNLPGSLGRLDDRRHRGKANYLFFDGHVAALTYAETRLPAGYGTVAGAPVDLWGTDGGTHTPPLVPTAPWLP